MLTTAATIPPAAAPLDSGDFGDLIRVLRTLENEHGEDYRLADPQTECTLNITRILRDVLTAMVATPAVLAAVDAGPITPARARGILHRLPAAFFAPADREHIDTITATLPENPASIETSREDILRLIADVEYYERPNR